MLSTSVGPEFSSHKGQLGVIPVMLINGVTLWLITTDSAFANLISVKTFFFDNFYALL